MQWASQARLLGTMLWRLYACKQCGNASTVGTSIYFRLGHLVYLGEQWKSGMTLGCCLIDLKGYIARKVG